MKNNSNRCHEIYFDISVIYDLDQGINSKQFVKDDSHNLVHTEYLKSHTLNSGLGELHIRLTLDTSRSQFESEIIFFISKINRYVLFEQLATYSYSTVLWIIFKGRQGNMELNSLEVGQISNLNSDLAIDYIFDRSEP